MTNRNPPPQAQLNVDPASLEDVTCEKCGNYTFTSVVLFKKVSALISPNGKEGLVPVETFSCNACGNINSQFLPKGYGASEKKADTHPVERTEATELPPSNRPKLILES